MLELHPVSYDHADAQWLTERAQEYYVEIYGGRDDDPLTAAELAPPGGGFVVGYLGRTPVAMGGWLFTSSPLADRVAQIRRMFVVPGLRGRGLGGAVLAHLEAEAAAAGATMMILATGRPQEEAIGLYRRHGYTDIVPFGYYADADQVVCLGRDLRVQAQHGDQPTS